MLVVGRHRRSVLKLICHDVITLFTRNGHLLSIPRECRQRIHSNVLAPYMSSCLGDRKVRSSAAEPPVSDIRRLVERVAAILDCPMEKAESIVTCQKKRRETLTDAHLDLLEQDKLKYSSLASTLRDNSWILDAIASFLPEILRSNMQYLVKSGFSVGSLYVVTHGGVTNVAVNVQRNIDDRVEFLCRSLRCSRSDALTLFEKHGALITMNIERLERVMTMLLENGVAPEHIRSDLWTLQRNEDFMRERLRIAHSVNLTHIKPWILRCAQPFFDGVIKRQRESNAVLREHENVGSYLAARLGLSVAEMTETMTICLPALLSVSPQKMKNMLDTLLNDFHLDPAEVQNFPYVFNRRVETLRERHLQLVGAGCSPVHLRYLCSNSKQFQRFLSAKEKLNNRRIQRPSFDRFNSSSSPSMS